MYSTAEVGRVCSRKLGYCNTDMIVLSYLGVFWVLVPASLSLARASNEQSSPCPPLFSDPLDPACRICIHRQFICRGKESFLHVDYRLFLNDEKLLMGHSIFELSQDRNVSQQALDFVYQKLASDPNDLNYQMCVLVHRSGKFCSRCETGYAPSPYTYYGIPCTKCSKPALGLLKYTLLELSFPTVVFFLFLLLRVRITSGFIIGFVFYCQVIANTFTSPYFYYVLSRESPRFTNAILTVYGFWNMDFFRFVVPKFCVGHHLHTLSFVALGYISAFYPLVLTVAIYCLMRLHQKGCRPVVVAWRPFHSYFVSFKRRFFTDDVTLIDTFATFLLLSYSKILLVSLKLLQPMTYYTVLGHNLTGTHHGALLYSVDTGVLYWTDKHVFYGILALAILVTFVLIPSLALSLYPTRCGRKMLSRCSPTILKDLNCLLNAFQCSFKNGQNGSIDYRMVSAIYIVHRVTLFITNIFLQSHDFITYEPFLMQAALYVSTFAFYSYAQPYKKLWHTCIELVLLTLLTAQSLLCFKLYGACPYQGADVVRCTSELRRIIKAQFVVLCVPQLGFLGYVLWLAAKKLQVFYKVRHFSVRCRQPLSDYTSLDKYTCN